jgi:hypothetical protein
MFIYFTDFLPYDENVRTSGFVMMCSNIT